MAGLNPEARRANMVEFQVKARGVKAVPFGFSVAGATLGTISPRTSSTITTPPNA